MQTKGVFGSLVRKNLSRYWLLSLVVFIILGSFAFRSCEVLWSYLGQGGMNLLAEEESVSFKLQQIWENHLKGTDMIWIPEFFSSNIAVFCVFSYLHKKKQDHFFQSLPVKRDSLFLSSLVSGLLVYVLPWLVVAALSAPVIFFTAKEFPFVLGMYLQTLLLRLVLYLASYSISLLAAVLCGRRFFAVFLVVFLHSLFPMLESYFSLILRDNLYGLSMGQQGLIGSSVSFTYLIELFCYNYNAPFPWGVLGIYAGISLLLIGLSFFLHRKRREEYVGQSLVFSSLLLWVQTLIALFIAYIGAEVFVEFDILPVKDKNFAYLCLFLFPFALVLARMLLLRSRKVFRKKAILQYVALTLCLSAVVLTFRFDLLGIVRKVPEAEDVTRLRIELNDLCFIAEEKEDIEDFLPIHQMIIDNRHALVYYPDPYGYDLSDVRTLKLTYEKNGVDLVRTYSLVYSLDRYDFVFDALEDYFKGNDRSVKHLLQLQKETEYATFTQGYRDLIVARFTLSSTQTEALFQALIQDMKEGKQALILQEYSYSFPELTLSNTSGDNYNLYLPRELKHTLTLLKEFQAEYNATLDP